MAHTANYSLYVYVGENTPEVDEALVYNVTPEQVDENSALEALSAVGLKGSDLRSNAVFVTDAEPDAEMSMKAVAAYCAIIGLSGRRLDVAFGVEGTPIVMASVDASVTKLGDPAKPSNPIDVLVIDNSGQADEELPTVDLSAGLSENVLRTVRFARSVILRVSSDAQQAVPELVLVAAMRRRGARERLPVVTCEGMRVDCEAARRLGDALRRTTRSDDRSALVDKDAPPAEYELMQKASEVDIEIVLRALGASSKEVEKNHQDPETGEVTTLTQTLWHCLHPEEHTNNDASPSARVIRRENGESYYRCYRCLAEHVDAVRLVMWAKSVTGDEAAQWIKQNCAN